MIHRPRVAIPFLLGVSAFLAGCTSGRTYSEGFVTREKANYGLVDFQRDERRESWALFCEPFLASGSTAAGNQYTDAIGGLVRFVNVPGVAMVLFYPFQYHDQPDATAHVFGVGSGEGDLRISVLWGMISLGRHWNVFWVNGFWFGHDDPLFPPVTDAARTYYEVLAGVAPKP